MVDEWMKILVPLVVTLLVTILISVWQARKSAASEACRIRAEREKTRLVRDKLEENHEQRLRSLEASRSADSAKLDTLSDTVTKGRVENAESFGKIYRVKNLPKGSADF